MDARFGGFTVRVDCPACGLPVPLNAPVERAHCVACMGDFPVPGEIFCRVLVRFDDDYPKLREPTTQALIAGLQVHVTSQSSLPSCEKCGINLALDALPPNASTLFHCTGCGDAAVGFPTPSGCARGFRPPCSWP